MADVTITATGVLAGSNAARQNGLAGEAITAGKAVYLSPSTKKWLLADNNSATADARRAGGIALNGAALNQPVSVQTAGDITIGATLTVGAVYALSDTPGGICPDADVGAGEFVCLLGIAAGQKIAAIAAA